MKVLLLLSLLLAVAYGRVGDTCHDQSECGQGSAVRSSVSSPIVSKRQLIGVAANTQGSCQLYKTEGQSCDVFEHANGYCGCGPGLQCHGEEVKLPARRSMIAPHPGYTWKYTCKAGTN